MSDQIIAIDLGTRSTKAVCLEKNGTSLGLLSYTIQDRPDFGKVLSAEALSKHLAAVTQVLNAKTKSVILAVGAADSVICHAEMPLIGTSEMRKMVKLNPKVYFQEDLPNHSFDCFVLHQGTNANPEGKQIPKAKTLVVGIKNQLSQSLQEAASSASLQIEEITAAQTSAANCFVMSSEAAQKKVVALADIGFSHSTISLLVNGEITLTRVVNIGADKFTAGLAEAMNITYSVAEGLKQIMPDKVHLQLKTLISPLCHELSNSIHFFEQQQDEKVSEVYVSGGSSRSAFIIEILQTELTLPCKSWDPTSSLKIELSPAQSAALKQEAPQLTVAIGAALSWFKPELAAIDLLAEQKEEAYLRSHDPMKRGYALAAALLMLMLGWYAIVQIKSRQAEEIFRRQTSEINSLQPKFTEADSNAKKAAEIDRTLAGLNQLSTNRFLWAGALNALQYTVVDNFQVVRLQINQQISQTKAIPAVTNANKSVIRGKPSETLQETTFRIQAKSFAKPSAAESFMEAILTSPWFKANLRAEEPVSLKESQAPLIDPTDPSKMTILFTVECYAERKL
ncbi:MAG: pilus assembly protein PilM [Verrucomicrobiota bacterium]